MPPDHDRASRAARSAGRSRRARSRSTSSLVRAGATGGRVVRRGPGGRHSRRSWSRPTSCSGSSAIGRSAPTATSHRISQHELATRLSYFLWASMPDAELRRAADTGTLREPGRARGQVRRMLRDPKSQRARRELRRPVAAVPRARVADARSQTSSRSSRTTCGCRCAARRSSSSSTSSATIAASSTSSTAATRS